MNEFNKRNIILNALFFCIMLYYTIYTNVCVKYVYIYVYV